MTAGKPASLWDRKGWLRRFMNGISRALKSQPEPALPIKPTILHPVEKLTLHNCGLFELYRGEPARPYLPLPGIWVVNKLSLVELKEGLCEYRFELNAVPDTIWKCFFQRVFPSTQARFDHKYLMIVCKPDELEGTYFEIKDAMLMASEWYAEDRDQLIPLVMALDEHRQAQAELEENRKLGLRNQFEGLPL